MSDLKEIITGMNIGRGAFLALVLADVFGGGFLAILVCWPDRFFTMDTIRLGMMAMALTLPVVALGSLTFQLALHDRHYEAIEKNLRDTVIYSVACHLMMLLLCFLAIGATRILPPLLPSVKPLPAQALFWMSSALHICNMAVIGAKTHRRDTGALTPVLHLAATILVFGLVLWGYNSKLSAEQPNRSSAGAGAVPTATSGAAR